MGPVKSQRRKLEHVHKFLVSAGIELGDSFVDGLCIREQDETLFATTAAKDENTAKILSLQNDVVSIDEVAGTKRGKG